MSSYKRVENRKYNQGEIDYVLARAQADWDNDTIAKAFKRDHAQYWGDREFNKKQVAYIRSSYKVPWGMVETHKGPMPHFPKSPTSEATPGPSSRTQQKGKKVTRQSEGTASRAQSSAFESANDFRPAAGAQRQQTQTYGLGTAGSSNQNQNPQPGLTNAANETSRPAGNLLLQQPANPGSTLAGDFFGLNASSTGLASGDLDFSSFDFPIDDLVSRSSNEPAASHVGFAAFPGGQQEATQQARGANSVSNGLGAQMGNTNTGAPSPLNFGHSTPSSSGLGHGPNLPDLPNFAANIPVQSVEREHSTTAAGTQEAQAVTTNEPSSNTAGQAQPAHSASEAQFPPGYTAANAVYRDMHGVWYYGSHDDCHISLGHRHDWDGGVHFSGEVSVTQSFANMYRKEGIGFLLGLAAGQVLHGTGPSQDWLQAATEIARGTLPEERQASVAVPNPEIIQRMMDVNEQLPSSHYYEPFTNRVVQYDMPAGLAIQNGKKGTDTDSRSKQGADISGGPAR